MKKVLALVLVAVLALGMGMTTFAATTSFKATAQTEALGYCAKTSAAIKDGGLTLDFGTIRPADKVKTQLVLTKDMFGSADTDKLTAADIRASKIAVRTQNSGGSKAIKKCELNNQKGQIEIEFITEYVSTKKLDFEITVYVTIDGKRQDEEAVTLVGTIENEVLPVYEEYDYIDLASGYVAEAIDFVPKIEVDLGNGVSIFTKFFKDKKYYGICTRDADEADDVVFSKYPDVDNVITLKTVGLNSTGDIVKLDTDYAGYFVYDKDMNYLGKASEMLPYSTKYYLANKKLEVEAAAETEPEETEPTETTEAPADSNPNMGGDGAIANANANPGTGR